MFEIEFQWQHLLNNFTNYVSSRDILNRHFVHQQNPFQSLECIHENDSESDRDSVDTSPTDRCIPNHFSRFKGLVPLVPVYSDNNVINI